MNVIIAFYRYLIKQEREKPEKIQAWKILLSSSISTSTDL